mmetsp:Transcript_36683/g.76988  ORF Transcript_36683/g.76988 Transcript_36683/m.76988 type:complete len:507 (+) Transcript_36683:194-1714(+)
MTFLCCAAETPFEYEARLSKKQLISDPIPIWWHRRRIHNQSSSWSSGSNYEEPGVLETSLFPDSWSINYSGSEGGIQKAPDAALILEEAHTTSSDESSVFSTLSQNQRSMRDAFGNCLKHPHVQLARRRHNTMHGKHTKPKPKSRLSRMFFKQNTSSSTTVNSSSTTAVNNTEEDKWDILRMTCPECEKEHIEKSKARYQYKPGKSAQAPDQQLNNTGNPPITHVPFPATLTIINSHPHLAEGTVALRVRTDPVPTDETMHLSCAGAATSWEWRTPEGAFDFALPADSNGKIIKQKVTTDESKGGEYSSSNSQLATPTKSNTTSYSPYQIMERIIPISSIDHVSRGGDAWDILRQSSGLNDHGCRCDVKIHGFSDRLLRFDVVNFDSMRSAGIDDDGGRLGHSFTDFSRNDKGSHAMIDPNSNNSAQCGSQQHAHSYTTDNVISKLNSIVLLQRVARKTGLAYWMSSVTRWTEEYCSLGAPRVEDPSVCITPVKGGESISDQTGMF